MSLNTVKIVLPDWLEAARDRASGLKSDTERMRFVIDLARESVQRRYGGPFGAAIFTEAGALVSFGVNAVVPQQNSILHAEVVAVLFAHQQTGHFNLSALHLPKHVLYTSCAPCAMCMGAVLWSGVVRVVSAARKEDAEQVGFNEGPVFEQTMPYMQAKGIQFTSDVCREEAVAVLKEYQTYGEPIYNAERN